eukprot:m.61224 g.61224  ORF g.61224 m.61224 type:complete len:303 (+) comp11851_c0_seq1:550-1458(+)
MLFVVDEHKSLVVHFGPNESIKTIPDATVTFSDGVEVSSRMEGGLMKALLRSILSRESFFFQVLNAYRTASAILAPDFGDVFVMDMDPSSPALFISRGAFLAATPNIDLETQYPGSITRGLFGRTGMFVLRAQAMPSFSMEGTHGGDMDYRRTSTKSNRPYAQLALTGISGVQVFELAPGEKRVVDNGHVVAWTESCTMTVDLAQRRSVFDSVASGEGLMCYFVGPGRVYVQPRKADGLRQLVSPATQGSSSSSKGLPLASGAACCVFLIFIVAIVLIAITAFATMGQPQSTGPRGWNDGGY